MDLIAQITEHEKFTRLCKALLCSEYPDFQTIDDSGGDGGNDGYSASEKKLFQIYCPRKPEKADDAGYIGKILADLKKAKLLAGSRKYEINEWIFVTPRELREPVQTMLRQEAEKLGFTGIAWASPKLTSLFAKHSHLRSQFPDLIMADIEKKADQILGSIEGTETVRKEYMTKLKQSFKQQIDAARDKLNSGKFESARTDYERIIASMEAATDPIDPHLRFRAYNNLGVSHMHLGNQESAAKFLKLASEAEPETAEAQAKLALAQLMSNQPEEALSIIDKVLASHPKHEEAISIRANILESLGRADEIPGFLRANGMPALALTYDGNLKLTQKDYLGAIEVFEAKLKLEPDDVHAMQAIGQAVLLGMQSESGKHPVPPGRLPSEVRMRFEQAANRLSEAAKLLENQERKSELEMAYANLSGCYLAMGSFDLAIEAASRASALDPSSAIPHLNKGLAQLAMDLDAQALESLTTYEHLGGGNIMPSRYLATCHMRLGNIERAIEIIDSELKSNGIGDAEIVDLALELYSRDLQTAKVEGLLSRLEREMPQEPEALRIRGRYLQKRGLEGAIPLFKAAVFRATTPSQRAQSELDLADAHHAAKDYRKSAEIYAKYASSSEPDAVTLRYASALHFAGRHGDLLRWINSTSGSLRDDAALKEIEAHSNLSLGNLEAASTGFKFLYQRRGSDLKHLVLYGMCECRLGRSANAKDAYDMIRSKVTQTENLLTLAGGYEVIGDRKSACELAHRALKADPHNPKAHLAFIGTFLKLEQTDGIDEKEKKMVPDFQKTIAEFTSRFPDEEGLKQFTVEGDDFSPLIKAVSEAAEVTENVTRLYSDSTAPFALLPHMTGKSFFDVWAALVSMVNTGIKMSLGTEEEAREEQKILNAGIRSVVVDILPLFLLGHAGNLQFLTNAFDQVYVHQSTMDELIKTIEDRKVSLKNGQKLLGKSGEKLLITEIQPDHIEKSLGLLEQLRDFLVSDEKVEIRGFSREKPNLDEDVLRALGAATQDSALLAKELDLPFYCDDGLLRAILRQEHAIEGFSSQSLFSYLTSTGQISQEEYRRLQKLMLDLNYRYISVDAAGVYLELKKHGFENATKSNLVSALAGSDTNVDSLGTVLSDLFRMVATDQEFDLLIRMRAFASILTAVSEHHDLAAIEQGVLLNLLQNIDSSRQEQLRKIVQQVFAMSAETRALKNEQTENDKDA